MLTEQIATALHERLGAPVSLLLVACVVLPAPLMIVARVNYLHKERRFGFRSGLLYGSFVGVWSSACWLVAPYLGAYPNLPWLIVARIISPDDSLQLDIIVMLQSVIGWILLGGALGLWIGRARNQA